MNGTVKWTRTGGEADSNSPHTANLTGSELSQGVRSVAALSNTPTLVDGAVYTVDFNVTDEAGNAADEVSVTGITYDISLPSATLTYSPDRPYKENDEVTVTATFNEDMDSSVNVKIAILGRFHCL